MKFLFTFLVCASSFYLYAQNGKSDFSSQDHLKIYINNLHLKKFKWMEEKHFDSLSTLLHENVHYIHSNGWKETKEELLHNIQSNKLSYQGVTIQESEVRIEGNTGIVTGKGTFNVSLDGKPMEIQLYYTEVYVITENGIRLMSRHACRM